MYNYEKILAGLLLAIQLIALVAFNSCVEFKHFDNLSRKQQNCPCLRN